MKRINKLDLSPEIEERMKSLTDIYVTEFNAERIILFGSFAKGNATEESSIDILIIARTTLRLIDRIKKAVKLGDGDPPVEPLVYTPSEINILLKQGEGFIDNILKEGILLYSK